MPCPLRGYCDRFLTPPKAAWLILTVAAGALAFALIFQYGFGTRPCILCLWQRVPFVAAILLAGLSVMPALRPRAPVLLFLCAVSFAIGAALAFFHTGVEQHWWLGTEGCAITPLSGVTAEDQRAGLLRTAIARCDEITWTFLGLSMANWNVPFSLALALFSGMAARRAGRE